MVLLNVLVVDCLSRETAQKHMPQSLARQADVLSRALLADLSALPDVEVDVVAIAACDVAAASATGMHGAAGSLTTPGSDRARATSLMTVAEQAGRYGNAYFSDRMQAADVVWPLAFESGFALEHVSRTILHEGRVLLGSAPGAVELAASKLKLAHVLAENGVATVPTYSPHGGIPQDSGAWVVKPDDGAGCLDIRLFSTRTAALAWVRAAAAENYVLQPFVAGKPGSLSLICGDGEARVLACNQERVAMHDNRFHALGCVVNGLADVDGTLARLARQVAAAIPSLWGYVGVDFVLTPHGAVVLDVNPRLTTAYAGLRASLDTNPAALVLDLLAGSAPTQPTPETGVRRPVSVDIANA